VAPGRDPTNTTVGEIAEEPYYTIDSDMDLEEAFHFLEEKDAERVPVVEEGRLVGILARELVQRRLAEDEVGELESE
jgi:CBS domain-containing protein